VIWGSGTPRREFLFVDDLADACTFLMKSYDGPEPVNVGSGEELSIAELAALLRSVVGFGGDLVYDPTKPDGTPRKLLDSRRIRKLGWRPSTRFADGLAIAYEWFVANVAATQGAG
jgi:GDP-L-fucose synthase